MSRPVFKTEFNTPSARSPPRTTSSPPGVLASSELPVSEPARDLAGCSHLSARVPAFLGGRKGEGGREGFSPWWIRSPGLHHWPGSSTSWRKHLDTEEVRNCGTKAGRETPSFFERAWHGEKPPIDAGNNSYLMFSLPLGIRGILTLSRMRKARHPPLSSRGPAPSREPSLVLPLLRSRPQSPLPLPSHTPHLPLVGRATSGSRWDSQEPLRVSC